MADIDGAPAPIGLAGELDAAGLLMPTGLPGLLARGRSFEDVVAGLERIVTHLGSADQPEILRFPPVMPQAVLHRNGYFVGFPHLAGCVHSFTGSAADHKRLLYKLLCDEPAGEEFAPTGCVLTPAACYPVYPFIAKRGPLPEAGALVDVASYCFRHEPSDDPARMQSFRMHEYVRIGSAEQAILFRDTWLERTRGFTAMLGLAGHIDVANDPFFGASGATLSAEQAARGFKFELLLPLSAAAPPAACMSFNYHETHFGGAWGLRQADGALAHTACVGFGMERLVLALLAVHGLDVECWPASVRRALWPAP